MTDKKIILFGAGVYGRRALNFYGPDRVYCFVDNNKASTVFWDKSVISYNELRKIYSDFTIILTVGPASLPAIEEQCKAGGITYKIFSEIVTHEDFESNPEIAHFKNKHQGERCFLIGNGPSLNHEDLTILHSNKIVSIACNRINKIFNKTLWRPNYYMAIDPTFFIAGEMLMTIEADYKFFPVLNDLFSTDEPVIQHFFEKNNERILYCRIIGAPPIHQEIKFSPDVSRAFYGSSTVMYSMMQLVAYMGFSEIYLLGVDGTFMSPGNPEEYFLEHRHFYEDDNNFVAAQASYSKHLPSNNIMQIMTKNAFMAAKNYTQKHGIGIFNATRGGKIEIFERVHFDSLFRKN